jgi:hypothetical protein
MAQWDIFSTTAVIHMGRQKMMEWLTCVCCIRKQLFIFYMCQKTTSPHDQTIIAKKSSWNDELAP